MYIHPDIDPTCLNEWDLFYGEVQIVDGEEVDDGRSEVDREEREELASSLCHLCPYRIACLQKSLAEAEDYGVWGGMGEGERRQFKAHLRSEGYRKNEVPTDLKELEASVNSFYRKEEGGHVSNGAALARFQPLSVAS